MWRAPLYSPEGEAVARRANVAAAPGRQQIKETVVAHPGEPRPPTRRLLPDAGAHLVQLGEERQVERAAQEVDARRPARAGLVTDDPLHDLEVAEAPLLEGV